MKKKVWDITVKDNPNRVVMGENDEFYTTDTEAFLVFNLQDKDFQPQSAMLTLENRNDGSLKSEEVSVVGGNITWEMPERYIEHSGNWQAQLVYEQMKGDVPEKYTSGVMAFTVNSHIKDKKKPSLVEIENWEKFIADGTELIETWEDLEDLRQANEAQRQANEAQRQANYQELLDTGILQTNINTKLEALEEEYAPKLTEVTAQLAHYAPLFNAIELIGSSQIINLAEGKTFYQELSTMAEYSFEADNDAESFKLILKTTGVSCPVIFPKNVIWYKNKLPELSQLYTTYILEFSTKDGGAYWYGDVVFRDFEMLPDGYVWATDDDFSGDTNGQFKYIGTDVKVAIPPVIKGVPVTSYDGMFIDTGVSGVYSHNRNVTSMNSMFAYLSAITLDLSSFDTSNVTDMAYMFANSSATTLDLSNFDTSSVTSMGMMFSYSSATTLDLSSFDTSNVTDMAYMFANSSATTGYARTQTDADKLNSSSNKPSTLNFIVK